MKINRILSYFFNSNENNNYDFERELIEKIHLDIKNKKKKENIYVYEKEPIEYLNEKEEIYYNNNSSNMTRDEFLQILDKKIKKIDPYFSREEFLEWTKSIFINFYHLVCEKRYEDILKFSTKELVNNIKDINIQEKYKITKDVDNLVIQYINLNGYMIDKKNQLQEIVCEIVVNMLDNTLNNNYNIEDENKNWSCSYELTFIRKCNNLIVNNNEIIREIKCKNCGASIDMYNVNSKCNYCNSFINYNLGDWKLKMIKFEK